MDLILFWLGPWPGNGSWHLRPCSMSRLNRGSRRKPIHLHFRWQDADPNPQAEARPEKHSCGFRKKRREKKETTVVSANVMCTFPKIKVTEMLLIWTSLRPAKGWLKPRSYFWERWSSARVLASRGLKLVLNPPNFKCQGTEHKSKDFFKMCRGFLFLFCKCHDRKFPMEAFYVHASVVGLYTTLIYGEK